MPTKTRTPKTKPTPAATPPDNLVASCRPIGDKVVVRRDPPPAETPGGLVLPDQVQTRTNRGTIVAVGPGRRGPTDALMPMQVKAGDRVVLSAYAGSDVPDLGPGARDGDYVIVPEADILAIMEK